MSIQEPAFRPAAVARISRCYPFISGGATFANRTLLHALAGKPKHAVWARTAGGMRVAAPLDDYVGRAAFFLGDIDRKVSRICKWLIRPGDTVFDIGANIGLVTFLMSALAGPNGKVHAFEPNPSRLELLRAALEKNRAANITLHPIALGEEEGELQLSIPPDNAGQASLAIQHPYARQVAVPVKKLSAVLKQFRVGPVRLVKIDVEGFEPQVLRGAAEVFSAQPPDAIVFELNQWTGRLGDHATFAVLRELGYGFFSIPKALFRLRLEPFESAGAESSPSHDFLAVHRGERYAQIARRIS